MGKGEGRAGYAVATLWDIKELHPLPLNTFTQKDKLIALMKALHLGQDKKISIYTDRK